MNPVVAADVTLQLGHGPILCGASLELAPREIVALMGASGSGKTTLLRVLLGFAVPDQGLVQIAERIASRDGKLIIAPEERNLAVVFQDLALWPHLTVRDNLAFGLERRRLTRQERFERITITLESVGLKGKEGRFPGELSGGERQRVAIARALVLEPVAVLLDEPLANLDMGLRKELLAAFREWFKERGVAALYVTHDPREADFLADRVAVMGGGRIVQSGRIADLVRQPASKMVEQVLASL